MPILPLRLASPDDAEELAALHVASWHESYVGILPEQMLSRLSVRGRAKTWARILADRTTGSVVYVAQDDGRFVAFGAACPQRDPELRADGFDGEFSAIYVLRSHQRRGIGREIMLTLAQALRGTGRRGAALWVLSQNSSARRFYERLGGELLKERTEKRADGTLVEVAYGWTDLTRLS